MNPSLEEKLQAAMEDAVVGEPMGPMLVGRLKTAARTVLLQAGHSRAQVQVQLARGSGFVVDIVLPAQGARVQRMQLSIQAM